MLHFDGGYDFPDEHTPCAPSAQKTVSTGIGAPGASRCEIGKIINLLLADEFVLYTATRGFHWNVTGTPFARIQELFEEQFRQLAARIEQLVECSCAIGVWPGGGLGDLAKSARLDSDPGADLPAEDMVAELCGLHGGLAKQLRADIVVCSERCRTPGILDDLRGLMSFHEEAAGTLHAMLAGGADVLLRGDGPMVAARS
jgi:starvation-inducible DNA-binding protein